LDHFLFLLFQFHLFLFAIARVVAECSGVRNRAIAAIRIAGAL
jgi:hypothetical protein